MREYNLDQITSAKLVSLMRRGTDDSQDVFSTVREIIYNVSTRGDAALIAYAKNYDNAQLNEIRVTDEEIRSAGCSVSDEAKHALRSAASNIEKFHRLQLPATIETETAAGVFCRLEWRPINRVGLRSEAKHALRSAASNIEKFHRLQLPATIETETAAGVFCRLEWRPINRVGL